MSQNPETQIIGTDKTITDFWQWGYSNLLTNSLRGVFAEFLVGTSLNSLNDSRVEWDAYDLIYMEKKIEVKSAAYIQSWHNGKHSKISFGIAAKKEYDYETNKYSESVQRHADIYVFCLLSEKDSNKVNPLDTRQWDFYVVPTTHLNKHFRYQKTMTLSSLQKIANPCEYKELKCVIDSM